ncbi:hypothetical protein MMC18_000558 [Xylographa bjoerkii]|nr:hypothetical protein [Xylographa bjoerkii]
MPVVPLPKLLIDREKPDIYGGKNSNTLTPAPHSSPEPSTPVLRPPKPSIDPKRAEWLRLKKEIDDRIRARGITTEYDSNESDEEWTREEKLERKKQERLQKKNLAEAAQDAADDLEGDDLFGDLYAETTSVLRMAPPVRDPKWRE